MSRSGWKALPDIREWSGALSDIREFSGDPPGSAGVVGSPSRISGSGREAFPNVRKALPVCTGVVKRPSQMSGNIQNTLSDLRES